MRLYRLGACGGVLGLADIFPEEMRGNSSKRTRKGTQPARAASAAKDWVPISDEASTRKSIAGLKYAMDLLGYYGGVPRSPILPVSDTCEAGDRVCPGAFRCSGSPCGFAASRQLTWVADRAKSFPTFCCVLCARCIIHWTMEFLCIPLSQLPSHLETPCGLR